MRRVKLRLGEIWDEGKTRHLNQMNEESHKWTKLIKNERMTRKKNNKQNVFNEEWHEKRMKDWR
jgi:hypothetical protein